MERRINADAARGGHDHLKHIAGVVQKLTYREMVTLGEQLNGKLPGDITNDQVTKALLDWADWTLKPAETLKPPALDSNFNIRGVR